MLLLRAGWVLTDPAKGTVLRDGAVRIVGNFVAEVGDAITAAQHADELRHVQVPERARSIAGQGGHVR